MSASAAKIRYGAASRSLTARWCQLRHTSGRSRHGQDADSECQALRSVASAEPPTWVSVRICRAPKPREQSQNPEPLAERIKRLTPALSLLLQVDGLVVSGLVELCTPHPVHALVFGSTEGHGRPEPNVEVAEIFQSPD